MCAVSPTAQCVLQHKNKVQLQVQISWQQDFSSQIDLPGEIKIKISPSPSCTIMIGVILPGVKSDSYAMCFILCEFLHSLGGGRDKWSG